MAEHSLGASEPRFVRGPGILVAILGLLLAAGTLALGWAWVEPLYDAPVIPVHESGQPLTFPGDVVERTIDQTPGATIIERRYLPGETYVVGDANHDCDPADYVFAWVPSFMKGGDSGPPGACERPVRSLVGDDTLTRGRFGSALGLGGGLLGGLTAYAGLVEVGRRGRQGLA